MEAEVGLLIKACAQQIEQVRTFFFVLPAWLMRKDDKDGMEAEVGLLIKA